MDRKKFSTSIGVIVFIIIATFGATIIFKPTQIQTNQTNLADASARACSVGCYYMQLTELKAENKTGPLGSEAEVLNINSAACVQKCLINAENISIDIMHLQEMEK